jgi:MraZ protein
MTVHPVCGAPDERNEGVMGGGPTNTTEAKRALARSPARFVGRYENKIDAKGRVSVPADLRRYLDPGSTEPATALYCFPSLLGAELQCGGPELVEILLQIVATADVFEGSRYELETLITEETERLYFDDNGRVVLAQHLRAHASLEGQVGFSGRGSHFVMAAPEARSSLRDRVRNLSDAQKDVFRARSLPSTVAKRGEEL